MVWNSFRFTTGKEGFMVFLFLCWCWSQHLLVVNVKNIKPVVEIHRLCILSITDKSMVTPGQALKFTFPTPKIHFSYNKHCFRKFDSSVAVSQEEHGSRVFAQTILSLGCCCVHLAGQDWRGKSRHGCGAVASEAKPAGPAPWEGHPHWHPQSSCFK